MAGNKIDRRKVRKILEGKSHRDDAQDLKKDETTNDLVRQELERLSDLCQTIDTTQAFPLIKKTIKAMYQDFRKYVLAKLAEESFNLAVSQLPSDTYQNKQALAKWINTELSEMGLALSCPMTGLPAIIIADQGRNEVVGRFRIIQIDVNGKRTLSKTAKELGHLQLTAAWPSKKAGHQAAEKLNKLVVSR